MKLSQRHAADHVRQPWKNGAGTSVELAVDMPAPGWSWRLSLADVEASGPFSDFAGYRRTIMLVAGRGMVLGFDAAPPARLDTLHRPFTFEGGWTTDCRLIDGPVQDLNLIWDPARVEARLDVVALAAGDEPSALAGDTAIFHGLAGRAELDVAGHRVALEPGDTLRVDAGHGAALTIVGAAQCKVARIEIRR